MKDATGKKFSVGDRIAYPQRSGSCLWMNLATVLELAGDCLKVQRDDASKTSYIYCYDRAVIFERAT